RRIPCGAIQAAAPVRAPRGAPPHGRRETPQAGPARRVLAGPRRGGVINTPTRTLSEHDSKRLLASVGVPVLDEGLVTNADDAVTAAHDLGAPHQPVVLKLCGAGVAHKSERGLVCLELRGDDDVREAAEGLLAAAAPEDGDVGVLVAPQARGSRELIAGVHR